MPTTGKQTKLEICRNTVHGDRCVIVFPVNTATAGLTSKVMGAYKAQRAGRIEDVTLYARAIDAATSKIGVKIGSTVAVTEVTVTAETALAATVITASNANVFAADDLITCVVTTTASTGAITDGSCAIGIVIEAEEYLSPYQP
jgi:hypothetical protein